jgi:hypothetical protein
MRKARDGWVIREMSEKILTVKHRDECQSRVWMAAMQREEWLSRNMDGKGGR